MPEEYDRLNQMRYVSLMANIEGEDLGRVSAASTRLWPPPGEPPRGSKVAIRGQVPPMREMFQGLAVGLGLAVVVVFLHADRIFSVGAVGPGGDGNGAGGGGRRGSGSCT